MSFYIGLTAAGRATIVALNMNKRSYRRGSQALGERGLAPTRALITGA